MRVQRPVLADLALEAERLAVGGQDQFNGRGIEADAMVERLHLVALVHATDCHHGHQHVHRLDQARIPREQRLAEEGLVRLHHVVDPRAGDIHARQAGGVVHDLVDLGHHDAVAEGGGLHQRGRVLGAGAGVEVAIAVGLVAGDQHDIGREIHIEPRVQLDVRVDRADFKLAIFQELRDAQALRAGVGKVQFPGNAALEQVEVFHPAHARDDHVQAVHLGRVHLGQRAREEVGLLLVVALQHHAVARRGDGFEEWDDVGGGHDTATGKGGAACHAAALFGAAGVPLSVRGWVRHRVSGVLDARDGTKIRSARGASNDARRGIVTLGVSVGGPTCQAFAPRLARPVRRRAPRKGWLGHKCAGYPFPAVNPTLTILSPG